MRDGLTPKERETVRTYEHTAALWTGARSQSPDVWREELEIFRKFLPGGKVLEIGAGSGRDAEQLIALGYDYTGTDITEALLEIARGKLPHAVFYKRSVYDLGFSRNSFDGFWASAVLLHVPKLRAGEALASIYGVTKPAGIGFVSLKEGDCERMEASPEDKTRRRFFAYCQEREFEAELGWSGFGVLEFHKKLLDSTTWLCYTVRKK